MDHMQNKILKRKIAEEYGQSTTNPPKKKKKKASNQNQTSCELHGDAAGPSIQTWRRRGP